ncbi:MAG: flagellar biosynthesis protein FlhF [Ideonella sp.]|nr:flagellar biosynthesis protein FlhF [Ideonella sp.]
MNIRRFAARTSRDALTLVRQALGDDAVVLSTKPCAEGVEVMAMTAEGVARAGRTAVGTGAKTHARGAARRVEPTLEPAPGVDEDVARLTMSTLSFQDYVRERMLRRRQAALEGTAEPAAPVEALAPERAPEAPAAAAPLREPPVLREEVAPRSRAPVLADQAGAGSARDELLAELRSVKGLIEDRFGALAFIDKLQRQPAQARLTQRLLDAGFSPALIRKLSVGLPQDAGDEAAWAAGVLERNLYTGEAEGALEEQGGVYALVGSTGVGKTTSTAKIAAAFATRHGASQLGLITLDAYRVAAHEQLRAYGRILGVPVHTAHDRSSLEDLLDLLSGKRMVLIDTAGMAQRDARTRELLDMLAHRSIKRLLVIDAASHGETIEDVMLAYRGATCEGVVLSKIDEAVKLGPALDALIRHKVKLVGVANGQRVPEDWHRLSARALVQRALRAMTGSAYRHEAGDVSLVFAGAPAAAMALDAARPAA